MPSFLATSITLSPPTASCSRTKAQLFDDAVARIRSSVPPLQPEGHDVVDDGSSQSS